MRVQRAEKKKNPKKQTNEKWARAIIKTRLKILAHISSSRSRLSAIAVRAGKSEPGQCRIINEVNRQLERARTRECRRANHPRTRALSLVLRATSPLYHYNTDNEIFIASNIDIPRAVPYIGLSIIFSNMYIIRVHTGDEYVRFALLLSIADTSSPSFAVFVSSSDDAIGPFPRHYSPIN